MPTWFNKTSIFDFPPHLFGMSYFEERFSFLHLSMSNKVHIKVQYTERWQVFCTGIRTSGNAQNCKSISKSFISKIVTPWYIELSWNLCRFQCTCTNLKWHSPRLYTDSIPCYTTLPNVTLRPPPSSLHPTVFPPQRSIYRLYPSSFLESAIYFRHIPPGVT